MSAFAVAITVSGCTGIIGCTTGEIGERLARMCGIVGILGREPVAPQLVDALKRLEYRGYNSAGVATLEDGQLDAPARRGQARAISKSRLAREPLAGTIGIGHTRWATHGRPTESNAHPHATERLAVVHNGIIENFRELREELESKGAKFDTETDTEVVAHLVTEEMKQRPRRRSRRCRRRCRGCAARSRSPSCSRARTTC